MTSVDAHSRRVVICTVNDGVNGRSATSRAISSNLEGDSDISEMIIKKVLESPESIFGVPNDSTLIVHNQPENAVLKNTVADVVEPSYGYRAWTKQFTEAFPASGIKAETH